MLQVGLCCSYLESKKGSVEKLNLPSKVEIREVGPRDGLQNEDEFVDTHSKVNWINLLSETGLSYIEVTSFVNPKWIPALSDSDEVMKQLNRKDGITYAALVPNLKGFEKALKSEVDEIALFISASEKHNKSNLNATISETLENLREVAEKARENNIPMRGYISTVFGSPFGDEVPISRVKMIVDSLIQIGVREISLGDTIGIADSLQVKNILNELLSEFPCELFAMHFHDTYGRALANILVSLEMGLYKLDSSVGGLGGCPYAPGATGNVSTNDLVNFLHRMGIETNINEEKLFEATTFIQKVIGKPLPSHVFNAQTVKS